MPCSRCTDTRDRTRRSYLTDGFTLVQPIARSTPPFSDEKKHELDECTTYSGFFVLYLRLVLRKKSMRELMAESSVGDVDSTTKQTNIFANEFRSNISPTEIHIAKQYQRPATSPTRVIQGAYSTIQVDVGRRCIDGRCDCPPAYTSAV